MQNELIKKGQDIKNLLRRLALTAEDWNECLALSELYGEFLYRNFLGTFCDLDFQRSILRRIPKISVQKRISGHVHYITRALESGGHTPLFNALVSAQAASGNKVSVIARKDTASLQAVRNLGVPVYVIETSKELFSLRVSGTFYLHSNPSDIEACIFADLVSADGGLIKFVNHADHAFQFRPTVETEYLEVSGFGAMISRKYRNVTDQSFLGIPVNFPQTYRPWKAGANKFLLTIARREKLRPNGELNFPRTLDQITRRYDVPLVIVGQTGKEPWWQDYRGNKNIRFLGYKTLEQISTLVSSCTAYVDSFPMTGGSVLAIVGYIGAPIFSPSTVFTGYNAAEDVRRKGIAALSRNIDDYLTNGALHYDLGEVSDSIRFWHSKEEFSKRASRIAVNERTSFPNWATCPEMGLDGLQKELLASLRFPFELSAKIRTMRRLKILAQILFSRPGFSDISIRSLGVSVVGHHGRAYRILATLRNTFRAVVES